MRQLSSWRFLVKEAETKDTFVKENLTKEAFNVAKSLMENVDKDKKGYITVEDLHPFFDHPKDIKHVLAIFDDVRKNWVEPIKKKTTKDDDDFGF